MLLFEFLVGLLAEAGLVPLMRMTEKGGTGSLHVGGEIFSELPYGSRQGSMDGLFAFGGSLEPEKRLEPQGPV
jgi:hypothetical protein